MRENQRKIENRDRKRKLKKEGISIKRRKTTDTENASEYSESTPSIQRAKINERVARLLKTAPK
jgi:hypothetical protein